MDYAFADIKAVSTYLSRSMAPSAASLSFGQNISHYCYYSLICPDLDKATAKDFPNLLLVP